MARHERLGAGRPAMDRIDRIHQLLQACKYPNSTTLAKAFEAATRTIKRDILFMKDRMHLPIGFDPSRNGYYYTKPVDHFPEVRLSEAETFALLVAQKAIAQYHDTPFERPLETAFRRLTGQLNHEVKFTLGSLDHALSFHPFAPGDADLRAFERITHALTHRLELAFTYRNHGVQTPRKRWVRPYHLTCIQNQWYLIAFDVRRGALRTFALTRLQRPVVTAKRFTMPLDFDVDKYLKGSFSVLKGGDDYEVVVDFDAWAADEVRGRRWHRSQELTELAKGMLRLRLRLSNLDEVEKWVLSVGTHCTVVRPQALRERLVAVGRELVKRYSEEPEASPSNAATSGLKL